MRGRWAAPGVLAAVVTSVLGCGGSGTGSGGLGTQAQSVSLRGTVATGAAALNAPIHIKCASASSGAAPVTDSTSSSSTDGSYQKTLLGAALPCLLQVQVTTGSSSVRLHGLASTAGVANLTPLTEAMVAASLQRSDTSSAFDNLNAQTVATLQTAIAQGLPQTAWTVLKTQLNQRGIDASAIGNPLSDSFSANSQGYDKVLDDVQTQGLGVQSLVRLAQGQALEHYSVAVAVANSAPVNVCPYGGVTVDSGIDSNGNGSLESSEKTLSQYVCHGSNAVHGPDGSSTLVRVQAEAPGVHCASGGSRIALGLDSNGNGQLDDAEASAADYVCNASAGSNGLISLLRITPEAAGANCIYGGSKVSSGIDADTNNLLDDSEVSVTRYTCNGSPAGLAWVDVASGLVAVPNMGYLASSSSTRVSILLPATASASVGDVVRISGVGAGGWYVQPNSGQQIVSQALGMDTAGATAVQPVTVLSSGSLWADQYESITVQYIGAGVWLVIGSAGFFVLG